MARTGGVQMMISQTTAGTIAELLVAADLMARGWTPFFPLMRTTIFDLIAGDANGRVLTIEVRSAKRRPDGSLAYGRKTGSPANHHALVITGEPVAYLPELPPGAIVMRSARLPTA